MKSLTKILLKDRSDREFLLDIYSDGSCACFNLDCTVIFELPLMIVRVSPSRYVVYRCFYSNDFFTLENVLFKSSRKCEVNRFVIDFAVEYMSKRAFGA